MTSVTTANFDKTMYNNQDGMGSTKGKFDLRPPEPQPDEQYKKIERDINKLIEDSAYASVKGNFTEGLEKAKEASNKEK